MSRKPIASPSTAQMIAPGIADMTVTLRSHISQPPESPGVPQAELNALMIKPRMKIRTGTPIKPATAAPKAQPIAAPTLGVGSAGAGIGGFGGAGSGAAGKLLSDDVMALSEARSHAGRDDKRDRRRLIISHTGIGPRLATIYCRREGAAMGAVALLLGIFGLGAATGYGIRAYMSRRRRLRWRETRFGR